MRRIKSLNTLTSNNNKVGNLIINSHGGSGYMSLLGRDYETGKTFLENGWPIDLKMFHKYGKDNNAYSAQVAKQIIATNQGEVTSYATYYEFGMILKRVDVTVSDHNSIPISHVLEYGRNRLPNGEVKVQSSNIGDPRHARSEEIP